MKRVFFEKDNHRDYLFVIIDHESDLEQIYKVNNFTDETGREYVYTLIGERKALTPDKLKGHVVPLLSGKYKNYEKEGELNSAVDCMETIISNRQLNKDQDIYVYVRNK